MADQSPGANHVCNPETPHHCWFSCGWRLHTGYGADDDFTYTRWEDRRGPAVRQEQLDDRTYADYDADGRVIGIGFRNGHGEGGCAHLVTGMKPFNGETNCPHDALLN